MPAGGTNFDDGGIAAGGTVNHYLMNGAGNWILVRCTVANMPSGAAGYAVSCLAQATDSGALYVNTGSITSSTFTLLAAGSALTLPFSVSDGTTTTSTSLTISPTALTSGIGIGLALAGLTSGTGIQVQTNTANFTTGGAAFKADLVAATAGNAFVGVTTGAYTGTGLLVLTANSATTGTVAAISATGLTTGKGLVITTSTGMTAATGAALSLQMGAGIGGQGILITNSGAYTDTAGIISITANTLTTGSIEVASATAQTSGTLYKITGGGANISTGILLDLEMGAATAGTGLKVLTSGVFAGSNNVVLVSANSATTSTGIVSITGTGLTSGSGLLVTAGGANLTSGGKGIEVAMGAATTGNGVTITSTGVYTAAAGNALLLVTANSATTPQGGLVQVSGTAMTTGVGLKVIATAATLTTGFYFAANDSALNVFTVGSNGHLTSNQTTAPTIATNATGLSAVAVTAGSTDTCGTITSTGTPASGTVITLTFNKTYTVAPKVVLYTPANAAAGGVNTMPIVTQTATTAVFTWPAGGVYAATPSWTYLVIA